MIGDKIELRPEYIYPANEILTRILPKLITNNEIYFITISGESGCGKSTLAIALQHCMEAKSINSYVFHMDDYFRLPPKSNHNKRLSDLNWVGTGEVNLDLLQENVDGIISGYDSIDKPLVDYQEDMILSEHLQLDNYRVYIIEGTYVSLLNHINLKIFIDRDYRDTLVQRISRARDPLTPFVEQVLEIEHQLIAPFKENADVFLNKDYSVSFQTN